MVSENLHDTINVNCTTSICASSNGKWPWAIQEISWCVLGWGRSWGWGEWEREWRRDWVPRPSSCDSAGPLKRFVLYVIWMPEVSHGGWWKSPCSTLQFPHPESLFAVWKTMVSSDPLTVTLIYCNEPTTTWSYWHNQRVMTPRL